MSDKVFKILAIDGGGIKGLYSANVLKNLEDEFEGNICDYFDMICGTSTGGIIALGLSICKPSSEIADLYRKKGKYIFPQRNWIEKVTRNAAQIFYKGKYSNVTLKKELESFFGTLKMKNSSSLLCIPSYNLSHGMPRVFKFPHREGNFSMDKELLLSDVALATSAAPSYLPVAEIDKVFYTDGGLWSNNPALVGMLEAVEYFVGEGKKYDSYKILSVSSIENQQGWLPSNSKDKSILGWNSELMKAIMNGQSQNIDYVLKKLIPNITPKGEYVRIPSPDLSDVQHKIITLDNTNKNAMTLLETYGDKTGNHYKTKVEVRQFFETKKTYNTNYYG